MAHKTHPGSKTNSGEGERQPIPMFVYDLKTWAILEVNSALIEKYGYPGFEFQALTLKDILPAQDAGITLRFGNAEILHTPTDESVDNLIHRADEAMFSAKKAGATAPCSLIQIK